MDPVRRQYEAYPYPERDPADEARRLIVGSPSDPAEIDHHLFAGRRDWTRPFRALVAGGGTGDGLVMLAQKLADAGVPAEITWLDLSEAAREIAEARMRRRGLSARFLIGDLATAPALAGEEGPFDYVDCCGVLHHLEDPEAGFRALAEAIRPEGGIGFMVYAPYGRSGVYELQAAFGALLAEDPPEAKVRLAKAALGALPESNRFRGNRLLSDHKASDAGLYDLLLHARDVPFDVPRLLAALEGAGLGLAGWAEAARYDPAPMLPATPEFRERLAAMTPEARWALAERLAGDLKMHVGYAAPAARAGSAQARLSAEGVARPNAVDARALARQVEWRGALKVGFEGRSVTLEIPKRAAGAMARLGTGRSFGEIAAAEGMDWFAFAQVFGPAFRALVAANLMRVSRGIAG